MISFEEFKKADLRVGRVMTAERVSGSDKLLRLEVDLGDEKRQVIAGIGKNYQPEELIDKQIIMVANLESRKILDLESQGMLLAADSQNGPVLLMPEIKVESGTKIR